MKPQDTSMKPQDEVKRDLVCGSAPVKGMYADNTFELNLVSGFSAEIEDGCSQAHASDPVSV